MCYLPGKRAKNSVKNNRRADVKRITEIAKYKLGNDRPLIIEYQVGNYDWGVLRVPHNWRDQSKNLNNDGTRRKMHYRLARRRSPKPNH